MQSTCLKIEYTSSSWAGRRTECGQRWQRERVRQGRAYDYGVERLAAYSGGAWNAQKMEYVYDGRGSVAQEVGYNNSWYTFGGKIGKASVVSKSYSPFGEQLGVAMSGYGFNGEYYDSATGMLNLRARQYEPAMGRFSQKDSWRGYATMGLSQNRFAYCVNDPVNLYDHGGNRFDEGGASVARNMRNGMSAAAAVAKSNQSQAKVQSAANKAAETRAKASSYQPSVSANNYNEEQRQEQIRRQVEQQRQQRVDSVVEQFNAATANVDRSKLSSEQQTTLDAAEKELRDKALKGTLTEAEKNSLINTACRAASGLSIIGNQVFFGDNGYELSDPSMIGEGWEVVYSQNRTDFNFSMADMLVGLIGGDYDDEHSSSKKNANANLFLIFTNMRV